MTLDDIKAGLRARVVDVAQFLFPSGQRENKDWREGDLTICVEGLRTGSWKKGEHESRDHLELWATRYGFAGDSGWEEMAGKQAAAWLEASAPRANGAAVVEADLVNGRTEPPAVRSRALITYPADFHREFPQAPQAEKGVLSSILLAPKEVIGLAVESGVTKESFYIQAHGEIFEALLELLNTSKPIDFITIAQYLRDRNRLDQIGGPVILNELFVFLGTAANANYYIEILLEKFTLREIIKVSNEYSARSYNEQDNCAGLLEEFEKKVFALSNERRGVRTKEVSAKEAVMQAVDNIERLYRSRGQINGLATGLRGLDDLLDGLSAPNLYVIAARPSQGKTALAMNLAEHIAIELGKPVGFFSLEMSIHQLFQRGLCAVARVNTQSVRRGFLSERDFPAITSAAVKIAQRNNLWVDDQSGITIQDIRARARRWRSEKGIAVLFLDYFQIIKTANKRRDRYDLELGEISTGCKEMAKELGIPVVLLAQLNRKVEDRSSGRPRMSDLKECGKLEEDADVVGLLTREEYYAETQEAKAEAEGKATLIIAKHRNGPIGDVPLTFLKEYTRFEDRADTCDAR